MSSLGLFQRINSQKTRMTRIQVKANIRETKKNEKKSGFTRANLLGC